MYKQFISKYEYVKKFYTNNCKWKDLINNFISAGLKKVFICSHPTPSKKMPSVGRSVVRENYFWLGFHKSSCQKLLFPSYIYKLPKSSFFQILFAVERLRYFCMLSAISKQT